MNPEPARVLVVSGGGFQGQTLIKLARAAAGARVWMVDCYEENLSKHLVDHFAVVPRLQDEAAFVEALLGLVREHHIQHIFPSTDRELPTLARHRARFEALGAQVAVSPLDLLDSVRDKARMAAWLAQRGLPTLPLVDPRDPTQWPIFGKPRRGWGGQGTVLVRSMSDLSALGEGWEESYIWQPYLEGFTEYSVDLCFAPDGTPSPSLLRERVRTSSGFAVVATRALGRAEVERLAVALAGHLQAEGARGLYNFQILEHGARLWVSDINPRVGTSSVFAVGAGFDLVGHWLGRAPAPPPARPLTMVRTLEERWFLDLRALGLRGVVFDVDDTLLDQKRWMFHKMRRAGRALGESMDEALWEERVASLLEDNEKGRFVDELARLYGWGEARRVALLEAYRQAVPDRDEVAYPDVEPALRALKQAGLALATLTDSAQAPYAQKMGCLGLQGSWDHEVCAQELGGSKREAWVFEEAARGLGLPASSLLMVGDHLARDILGASRAGFGAVCHLQRAGRFHHDHPGLSAYLPAIRAPLAHARSLTEVVGMLGLGR